MTRAHHSHRTILAADDIHLLRRLNRGYLDLLTLTEEGEALLAPELMRDLAAADGTRRDAIAACAYSLFAFELPEAVFDPDGAPQVHDLGAGDYRVAGDNSLWAAFATAAWFFAWHLNRSSPLSARLMLGLKPAQASVLANLVPWQLCQLVALQSAPPVPRWRSNVCFWPELVRFAGSEHSLRLTVAHLLGLQLLAAEAGPAGQATRHARLRGP